MELNELIHQAQEAMDQGDYRRAAAACAHALGAYPTCLSAHRLLGESCLEQGEVERATEHFERTLTLDPLNVVARLGLGVACEERGDPRGAYTNYLRAWDLNPALDQIRDELVRLRAALGTGGRLHLTRAGLASTYLRGGQFGRAAAEWRAVLAAEPEGDRARLALAEVLWRQGDEAGAAAACRELLRGAPENARALAILAAIELRRGEESGRFTAERYRTTDPAGDVVALLRAVRPDVDFAALTQPAPLADFVYEETAPEPAAVDAAELVGNHHAGAGALGVGHIPAPDLWDSVVRDLGPMPFVPETAAEPALDVVPFAWADGAATAELSAPVPPVDGLAGRHPADPRPGRGKSPRHLNSSTTC